MNQKELLQRVGSVEQIGGVRDFIYNDGRAKGVRAIELYLTPTGDSLVAVPTNWAAIDKKRNVITPVATVPAVEKQNTTPGGLHVDGKKYSILAKETANV